MAVTAPATRNMFAGAKSIAHLESLFEVLMSPENLYADGERSQREAIARAVQLKKDFSARHKELSGK
jgi:hypothetical protein